MSDTQFGRQELLFGKDGQEKIAETSVAIVGVGGNGTQVAQDLAHLGTQKFLLIEPGRFKQSSRNRYIGHRHDDPIGVPKIAIAQRMIWAINPNAEITAIAHPLESPEARAALGRVDVVFGCLDNEGPRFTLNKMCAELQRRLIDVATEILPEKDGEPLRYGGRVFVLWERPGCLVCCDVLDMDEVGWQLEGPEELKNREAIYGLRPRSLNGSGPSVVTLNGIMSSIATTEFMLGVVGLRNPVRLTTYRADLGKFTVSKDVPKPGCFTCAVAMANALTPPGSSAK
jgi:hypothetical protein